MNVVSISLFTYVITNNQVELITDNTRFQAKELVSTVVQNLRRMPAIPSSEKGWTAEDKARMANELSQTLTQFVPSHVIFEQDLILKKSTNEMELPADHIANAKKATTLKEFSGSEFHLIVKEQERRLHFYVPLDDFGMPQATIFISMDMLGVGKRFRALYQLIVVAVIALTLLHVLFGLLIYRMILTPVLELNQATQTVASGQYDIRVNVKRQDEIGALAEGFNYMLHVIRGNIKSLHDRMDELQKAKEQIEHMAITDELTGLYNRRYLFESLEKMLAAARRYNKNLGLILIDIDHFKKVNDTYGHQVGDSALRNVAERLQQSCRDSDLLARYGGEELVMVLPETDLEQTYSVAQKLRGIIEKTAIRMEGHDDLRITISLGVSELRNLGNILSRDIDVGTLLEAADLGLYMAKSNGRNRVERIIKPWDQSKETAG